MANTIEKIKDKVEQVTHTGPYSNKTGTATGTTGATGTHYTAGTHTTGTHTAGTHTAGTQHAGTHHPGAGAGFGAGSGAGSTNAGRELFFRSSFI
jgi:hypothetical protein